MRTHRFIVNFQLKMGRVFIDDKDLAKQLKNVLRLKPSSKILLCDGNLNEAEAEIAKFGGNGVEVEIKKLFKNQNEPAVKVALYCSILKRENFEIICQKATEVGVSEIVPLICKRTVKTGLNKVRLEKIIKEAAEQSGRGMVPLLREPVSFDKEVKRAKEKSCDNLIKHLYSTSRTFEKLSINKKLGKNEKLGVKTKINLFFDSGGTSCGAIIKPQTQHLNKTECVGVFVGPEGGWDSDEVEMAKNSGFEIVSLGKLTLRAETAAIVAPYLAANKIH